MSGKRIISIYYESYDNVMKTQNGNVFYDIFKIISPYDFSNLKRLGGTVYIPGITDDYMYELIFPIEGEDYDEAC